MPSPKPDVSEAKRTREAKQWDKPDFCRDRECPHFKVIFKNDVSCTQNMLVILEFDLIHGIHYTCPQKLYTQKQNLDLNEAWQAKINSTVQELQQKSKAVDTEQIKTFDNPVIKF